MRGSPCKSSRLNPLVNETLYLARRALELHFLRHFLTVLVAQVPVDSHCQRTTILVPQPAGNGRNVHAARNAPGCEEVAEIMVTESMDA